MDENQQRTSTIKNFLNYLKHPTDEKNTDATFGFKLKTLVILFLFSLPIIYTWGYLFSTLQKIHWLNAGVNVNASLIYKYSFLKLMLICVISAPALEELLFRLPLRYKYNYLLQLLAYLIGLTGFVQKENWNETVQKYWQKHFVKFFYLLTIAFGFVHMYNFVDHKQLWTWIIVLVFPQLFIGTILGYIRVQFSLPWSMAYHAFHNFMFFGIQLLFITNMPHGQLKNKDTYMVHGQCENKDFSFSLKNGIEDKIHTAYTVSLTRVEFLNFKLANVLEIILNKPSKYFLKNKIDETYVNINFINNSKQTSTKVNRIIVSEQLQKMLKVKFEKQMVKKEVLELYIADSIKYKNALSELSSTKSIYSFKQICHHLDCQYNDNYFACNDSIHLLNINFDSKITFNELRESWKKQYGLGFRKKQRELEFINIK
jgi:hypothetical protein